MTDILADLALGVCDSVTLADEGTWCPIMLPNGNPAFSPSGAPVMLKLLGGDGAVYNDITLQRARAAMADAKARGGAPAPITSGVKEQCGLLKMLTVDWKGFEKTGSTKDEPVIMPFTQDAVEAVYLKYPLIRDQADRWISTRANFMQGPSKS